jgi:hypothetical protein
MVRDPGCRTVKEGIEVAFVEHLTQRSDLTD